MVVLVLIAFGISVAELIIHFYHGVTEKLDKYVNRLISLSSGIWLVFLFLFAWRVKLQVGHWPFYAHPDPKSTGLDFHYVSLWCGSYALFWLALSKLLSLYFRNWRISVISVSSIVLGVIVLGLVREFGGLLIISSVAAYLLIFGWTTVLLLKRRARDFDSLCLTAMAGIFWIHALLDPFRWIDWFLD